MCYHHSDYQVPGAVAAVSPSVDSNNSPRLREFGETVRLPSMSCHNQVVLHQLRTWLLLIVTVAALQWTTSLPVTCPNSVIYAYMDLRYVHENVE